MSAPPPWHPGPQCGCWSCMNARRHQRKNPKGCGADAGLALSIVWAILSGIAWAYTDSAAHTCQNTLVGALAASQCTTITFWHDVAAFSAAAGALGIVFAGHAMRKDR